MLEKCFHCKDLTDEVNDDGVPLCSSCSDEHCYDCGLGECEVETPSGDYICSDCHSGRADAAYEAIHERD